VLKLNNGENIKQLYNSAIKNGYTGSQNAFQEQYITIEKTLFCEIINCRNKSVRLNNTDDVFTTSGRLKDWNNIIYNFDYKNNLFFGYGSQGDRFLINQTDSNGILYALSSSGIIGLLFFIIFSAIAGINIVKYFLIKTEKNSIYIFSILTMIIFGVRSLVESSYAIFGIDFILFYTAFVLSEKYNIIKK
jgi:O-antigen ligase